MFLVGCDIDEVNRLLGLDGLASNDDETISTQSDESEEENSIVITGITQVNEPVITINDDESAVIVEEQEEVEVEEEYIFDPVNKMFSAKAANNDAITLAFVGDVGFAQGYATINKYRARENGVYDCFDAEVLDIMQSVDIMMANNEFPYSNRGTPTPNKTYTFRANPDDVSIMKDMGVDIVSLANNHAYDYGPEALLDTLDTLTGAEIAYVGAGANIDEAIKPAYFKVGDHTIGYVSATQIERYGNPDTKEATSDSPGVLRTLEPSKAVAAIEEARANSDFVVMYVHWGSESTDLVEQSQRDLAKAYVDAGVDLVIGDHSHCLQGIDYIDDVPIFYSLGNYWFNSKTLDTCIVKITLDSECKLSKVEFIPCIQKDCRVIIGDGDNFDRILEYMRGISNYATIDSSGVVTKSDTDNNRQNGQNTSPARKAPEPEAAEIVASETPETELILQ